MDFEWVAIVLGDVVWISLAFALGLLSRSVGLPPLVGFLAAGFLLNARGIASGEILQKLADLGITLLLFTVGLKLNLRTLAGPQVWAVTGMHTSMVVGAYGAGAEYLSFCGFWRRSRRPMAWEMAVSERLRRQARPVHEFVVCEACVPHLSRESSRLKVTSVGNDVDTLIQPNKHEAYSGTKFSSCL